MENDLHQLVNACVDAFPKNGLSPEIVNSFCEKHKLQAEQFSEMFSKHVALEFAYGEISYGAGDCAMNSLMGFMQHEVSGFVMEVFSAFDSGEFSHNGDSPITIPWQKYTLPVIMELLVRENLLPRT
jgi:hypothetical protein